MFSTETGSFFRALIAALAMLALMLAPVASAEPGGPVSDAACETGALPDAGPDAGHDGHDGHDHHAHGCGSCHVHLIAPGGLWPPAQGVLRAYVHPIRAAGTPVPRPGELFRPPRA